MKLSSFSLLLLSLFSFSVSAQTENEKKGSNDSLPLVETDEILLNEDNGDILKQDADSTIVVQTKVEEKIIESDEELILDDGEEYLIAPSKVANQNDSDSLKLVTDSAVVGTSESDSLKHADASELGKPVNPVLPKPEQIVVSAKSAKIENMQSINFAHNLKQYRSPKLAMLFSFLLPGTGQFYARNKLKAGIFGAVEAVIIGTGIGFYAKGKKEMDRAHEYADQNYDVEKFKYYYDTIFKPNFSDTIRNSIFIDPSAQDFIQMAKNREDDFYEYIKGNDKPFVHGWKDAAPKFLPGFVPEGDQYKIYDADSAGYLVYHVNDTNEIGFGFSKMQGEFETKFSNANNLLDISQKVFFLLLLDRIVSAVDAGITAKAYNDEMLGKQSFWQNINILEKQVCSGADIYSGYALEIRF